MIIWLFRLKFSICGLLKLRRKLQKEFPADKAGLNVLFVPSEAPYHET